MECSWVRTQKPPSCPLPVEEQAETVLPSKIQFRKAGISLPEFVMNAL